jgi:hypothetical protein
MRIKFFFALASVASLLSAAPALAHEHQEFRIGGKEYEFTIGSLNEPVYVDDKTGVDMRVERMEKKVGIPVEGLEKTLRVELIAGDVKRVQELSTVYGTKGAYKSPFYPTVATTLSYRIYGTLEGHPVDLVFTCNPVGHPQTAEDTTEVDMGDGVIRTHKAGAFGCPKPKEEAGFPEPAPSLRELSETAIKEGSEKESRGTDALPLALGILGTLLGGAALAMKR